MKKAKRFSVTELATAMAVMMDIADVEYSLEADTQNDNWHSARRMLYALHNRIEEAACQETCYASDPE